MQAKELPKPGSQTVLVNDEKTNFQHINQC